jgi:hypothetical protein
LGTTEVSNPNASTLIVTHLLVAAIYLKRECSRLAEWTGLGEWVTVVMAAALSCVLAIAFTLSRGYSEGGVVLVTVGLGFVLTGSVLACLVLLRFPGGTENYYLKKQEYLLKLRKEYAAARTRRMLQHEAERQQALQEQAKQRAQEDARRKLAEDLARQQAAREIAFQTTAHLIEKQLVGNGPCWYCHQPVPAGRVQCVYCRVTLVR